MKSEEIRVWDERKSFLMSNNPHSSLIVTIPATLRKAKGISKGDKFRVITKENSENIILEPVKSSGQDLAKAKGEDKGETGKNC